MPGTSTDPPSGVEGSPPAPGADATTASSSELGTHVVMFWLLVGMAALVFAPCILIPIWLETENLSRTETDVAARTAGLKAHIAEQDRLLKALTSDPLVNERIARRDLRFRRTGERVEPVQDQALPPLPDLEATLASLPNDQPAAPPGAPAVIKLTRRWLPDLPWVELFARPPNRTIFLVMAGGLLVAAFVLYGQTDTRSDRRDEPSRQAA